MRTDLKIVVIGGGSGISVVLRGIKKLTNNITAVVTMADNGGSSGKLRTDLGMLPPGDIRNCLLALSDTEELMYKLMQHRFKDGEFEGHSLGNLLIAGLVELTGGFESAMTHMHNIFAVMGKVLPVTLDSVDLVAVLDNGKEVYGEVEIPEIVNSENRRIERIRLEPSDIRTTDSVINCINEADIIMLGPGSLYTSVIPNLVVTGVSEAIKKSSARVVYCCNLFSQLGETKDYNVLNHIEAINRHVDGIIDTVIVNNGTVEYDVYMKYREEGVHLIHLDYQQKIALEAMGIKILEDDYIEIKDGYVRHNADKIANELVYISGTRRYK